MRHSIRLIRSELLLLVRGKSFTWAMILLCLLMTIAVWNTHNQVTYKKQQIQVQRELVADNDAQLIAQMDSLNKGLATYENSYTLPTSGVRLTYNNHRLAWMPMGPFSLLAIGQGDIYSNYKKIVLYFDESYEMTTQELVSPIEQVFGQLDLVFIWVYILPLIIIVISFNALSAEKESGRLAIIASQPINVPYWVFIKIVVRLFSIFLLTLSFTGILLHVFGVAVLIHFTEFGQLAAFLFLYAAFWFLLSITVNLLGYSSGSSLIVLSSFWVLFVFLIPSIVNQAGKELHPIPARLEIVNHHQGIYNAMESNLEEELQSLFLLHPDWASDDPITKDLSNSTGWNINYLAKQYMAQIKHQPTSQGYEDKVDRKNTWLNQYRVLSPAMILQSALSDMAGTSTKSYRSFLRQAQRYASAYREYVFRGLFTNHVFTSAEIRNLPTFVFDRQQVPDNTPMSLSALLVYLATLSLLILFLGRRTNLTNQL